MKQTLDYYDTNVLEFFESTIRVETESLYQPFCANC